MTVLGRKQVFLFLLALIAFVGGFLAWKNVRLQLLDCTFRADGGCVTFERAETAQTQEKGLSGREQLAANTGMLFVFQEPSDACFWMKDMHFSIDMVWTDSDWRIITIEKNVSPGTYPKLFCSTQPAHYVLELKAGAVDLAGVMVGDHIKL